jgi:hypothetical protein
MTGTSSARTCAHHFWERRLEVRGGIECVVRFCRRCGRKELVWSRRPLPADELGLDEGSDTSTRRIIADD